MVTGLEIVLPKGKIIRTGSCSVSDYWFAKAPLPDLSGLFFGMVCNHRHYYKGRIKTISSPSPTRCQGPDM